MQSRAELTLKLNRVLDVPMAVTSVLFLVFFIASLVLADGSPHQVWLSWAVTGIWVLFAVEFLVRLAIAPVRRDFIRRNWLDLLAVALPALRGLRLVQAFRALGGMGALLASTQGLRVLSLSRVWLVARRGITGVGQFLRLSRFATVLALTGLVVVLAAALVLRAEQAAAGANIQTFGDALWWSAALVTTVASEKNPVTGIGRIIAVAVMVYGMAVFGYFMSCAVVIIQGRSNEGRDSGQARTPDARYRRPGSRGTE